jgi:ribose 5-phosphate isomerase B
MPQPSEKPRIALGADHAGYHVKETLRQFLENAGYPVDDLGTWSEESVDYPDYGKAVADRVAAHQDVYGLAVCGTGMGMAIAANKVPGIRAAVAHNVDTARLAREHNDANVLTMGGRVVSGAQAIEMVQTFLNTTFAGGRHARRVEKITQIEAAKRG